MDAKTGSNCSAGVRLFAEVALWTATAILATFDVFLIGVGLLFNDTRVKPERIIFHVGSFAVSLRQRPPSGFWGFW